MSWRDGSGRDFVGPSTNYTVAQCFHTPEVDSTEANARRIVACVNACAGLPTTYLEQTSMLGLSKSYHAQHEEWGALNQQRDELLSALKSLAASYERIKPPGYPKSDAEKQADYAINEAEAAK
jgi:hypothetical protein